MHIQRQKTIFKNFTPAHLVLYLCVLAVLPNSLCSAITSKITRQSSSDDFLKGQNENVVIDSKGTIKLGLSSRSLVDEFEDVWSINSIVEIAGAVFVGTSPNGGIYKYSSGEITKIYPEQEENQAEEEDHSVAEPNEPNGLADANAVSAQEHLSNEHIFAMGVDTSGRLLAGISGDKCQLVRYDNGEMEIVFEPNDTKYIFAIAHGKHDSIYLGTGPEGKIYKLDSNAENAEVLYDSKDKNILSLAVGADGFVYAGSDTRGLVYRIDPDSKKATVLYDSEQDEITALLFDKTGQLYAAATSAQVARTEKGFAAKHPPMGRPETKGKKPEGLNTLRLKIPNTEAQKDKKASAPPAPKRKPAKPAKGSHIYRISKDGFVTDVFSEAVVLFTLVSNQEKIFAGTGNRAELYSVEPATEQQVVLYEDTQASLITSLLVSGDDIYVGTANPAKLMVLESRFAQEGTYTSDLIDASQPARWGKLQIEADIPSGCGVLVASRSGNVKDINDPTFSPWSQAVGIEAPVQLDCPQGRFCQYKLILKSPDGLRSPDIREVALAHTVPNLAPKVDAINVALKGQAEFKISYKATDGNDDKLIYKIDCKKLDWENWIELEDESKESSFEWDGRTVEDGRYEIRVTACDEPSNTIASKLTGVRVSDPIVVDNSPPKIIEHATVVEGDGVTLTMKLFDKLSAIGKLEYTVNSSDKWKGLTPEDGIYDTTEEDFVLTISDMQAGEHIISIRFADAIGNAGYKSFKISVNAK
jgi:hypothetical protein